MSKFHEYKWNNSECQSWCLETPKNKLHVRQRRVESTAATPQEPQQLAGELLRWRLLQGTAAAMQVDTSQLEVVIEVVIRKVRCKKQLFVVTCVGFA